MKLILMIIVFIILWCLLLIHINKQKTDVYEWSKERNFINNQVDIISNCHLPMIYNISPTNFSRVEESYITTIEDFTKSELSDVARLNSFHIFVRELNKYEIDPKLKYAYLLFKMIYGDFISFLAFKEINPFIISQENFISTDEQFSQVISIAEEMRHLVGGMSSSNQAFYLAYKYLIQFPFTACSNYTPVNKSKHFRLKDNQSDLPSFVEMKTKVKFVSNSNMNTNAWFHIKVYKAAKKIPSRTISLFPILREVFHPKSNLSISDCINMTYDNNDSDIIFYKTRRLMSSIQFQTPLASCPDQLIGPATKLRDKEPVFIYYKVDTNTTTRIRVFTSSEFESAYNCHGWGIGLEDFISAYSVNLRGVNDITTCYEYKLFLSQLKIAYNNDKVRREYFEYVKRDHDLTDKIKIGGFLYNFIKDTGSTKEEMMAYLRKKIKKLPNSLHLMQAEIIKYCPHTNGNEPANGTLLLYGANNIFAHTARYSTDFHSWTSKLGQLELITHGFHDISGESYGIPKFFVCPSDMKMDEPQDDCGSF